MNSNSNSNTSGQTLRRRLAKAFTGAAIVVGSLATAAGPASAETDTVQSACITAFGMTRGCATDISVTWGSGWSWRVAASTKDVLVDNGNVVVEVKLNRKYASNTRWMLAARSTDHMQYYGYGSIEGYDPTYGAWVRVCTNLNTGKYCLPEKYVRDNS